MSISDLVLVSGARPLLDETFGSWLRRLAAQHYVSLEEFARALLAEWGEELPLGPIDWDVAPPPALVYCLRFRTCLGKDVIEELICKPREDSLRLAERGVFCPECWESADPLYTRKSWLSAWCTVCFEHRCLLAEIHPPWESKLQLWTLNPASNRRRGARPPLRHLNECRYSKEAMDWLRRVQNWHVPDVLAFPDSWIEPPVLRPDPQELTAIRDVVMLMGCSIDGVSLLEWTMPASNQLAWRDDAGRRTQRPGRWQPLGHLLLRAEAIRMAGEVRRWLWGDLSFARPEDADIYAALRRISTLPGWSALIGRTVGRWDGFLRDQWARTFDAPWLVRMPLGLPWGM